MARDWFDADADLSRTPDYARSDHAQIVGYSSATDGHWRAISDNDWAPPTEEDLAFGDKYLIAIDTSAPGTPENMPNMVQWIGPIDGISLDDVYDYYVAGYESLAD
jgi:hypothetical protein